MEKIDKVLEIVNKIVIELKEVKKDITELKQDVAVLKQDVAGLKQRIQRLEKEVRKNNKDLWMGINLLDMEFIKLRQDLINKGILQVRESEGKYIVNSNENINPSIIHIMKVTKKTV